MRKSSVAAKLALARPRLAFGIGAKRQFKDERRETKDERNVNKNANSCLQDE